MELCEYADLRIEAEGGWEPGYEPTEEERAEWDLNMVERDLRWAEAGAADQFHYDMHESGRGITEGLRLIETFRARPELDIRLNFHWHWQPHQHLAFGVEAGLWPYLECSTQRKVPGNTEEGHLLPPDWIGVYDLDAEQVGRPRN